MTEQLLTVRQAAERLNYSEKTIRKMMHDGRLPPVKLPGSRVYRFKPEVIAALVDSSGTDSGAFYFPQEGQSVQKRAPLKRSRKPPVDDRSARYLSRTKGVVL